MFSIRCANDSAGDHGLTIPFTNKRYEEQSGEAKSMDAEPQTFFKVSTPSIPEDVMKKIGENGSWPCFEDKQGCTGYCHG